MKFFLIDFEKNHFIVEDIYNKDFLFKCDTIKNYTSKETKKDTILEKIKSNELPKVIKGTQKEIVDLLNNLKKEESLKKFEPELKKLLLDIKNVTPKTLKETLLKSGISLEAKIIPSHKI